MKKSRYSEEQIIGFLKQADAGMPIKQLCREGGFSDATFYKWHAASMICCVWNFPGSITSACIGSTALPSSR